MNGVEVSANGERAGSDGVKYEHFSERIVKLRVHDVDAADTASTYECVIETEDGHRRTIAGIRIQLSGAPSSIFEYRVSND